MKKTGSHNENDSRNLDQSKLDKKNEWMKKKLWTTSIDVNLIRIKYRRRLQKKNERFDEVEKKKKTIFIYVNNGRIEYFWIKKLEIN